ncbi:hypothetical protein BU16DRAFT_582446 [Lophium mytilinum]|uniref:Uncharacterized protein n=1 Tax=Lophium mytilinum TaxID=390894 RepID=A0A6A6QQT9_9PEZI|nr:hypothetical protein BU16DRAFT_582446 [Lophium mytilinum]
MALGRRSTGPTSLEIIRPPQNIEMNSILTAPLNEEEAHSSGPRVQFQQERIPKDDSSRDDAASSDPSQEEHQSPGTAAIITHNGPERIPSAGFPTARSEELVPRSHAHILLSVRDINCGTNYDQTKTHKPTLVRTSPNHAAFQYIPGLVGTVSTIWWRAVARSYLRIMPYISMAALSSSLDCSQSANYKRMMYSINSLTIGGAFSSDLIKDGHWLTLITSITTLVTAILFMPLKSSFVQTNEDSEGWVVVVSSGVGYSLVVLYALLIACVSCILIKLTGSTTGLKWEPSSLAAQFALLNNTNIFREFSGLEFVERDKARSIIRSWADRAVLRLGYWQNKDDGSVIHGVRFLNPTKAPQGLGLTNDDGHPQHLSTDSHHFPNDNSQAAHNALGVRPPNVPAQGSHTSSPEARRVDPVHLMHHRPRKTKDKSNCLQTLYDDDDAVAPRYWQESIVCSPQYMRYRVENPLLSDLVLTIVSLVGLTCFVASIAGMIQGNLYNQIRFAPILYTPPFGHLLIIHHQKLLLASIEEVDIYL